MAAKGKTVRYGEGSVYPIEGGRWEASVRINGKNIRRSAASRDAAEEKKKELLTQRADTERHVAKIDGLKFVVNLWLKRIPPEEAARYHMMLETRLFPVLEDLARLERDNVDVAEHVQLIEDWMNTWYNEVVRQRELKPLSLVHYKRMINQNILPYLEGKRLYQLNASIIQAMVNNIRADILEESEGRYTGAGSARMAYGILRDALTIAYQRGYYTRHPCDGVILPPKETKTITPLTDEELRRLLQQADATPLRTLWYIYALMGLRRGEGLGLAWPHIDWDAKTIKIEQQVFPLDGVATIGAPKTKSSRRLMPLPNTVFSQLRALYEITPPHLRMGLIFVYPDGGMYYPQTISNNFYRLCDLAELPADTTQHHLRHTVATLLDEVDATETIKAALLGHGKKNVTQHYTSARIAAMRRPMLAVEQRVLAAESASKVV